MGFPESKTRKKGYGSFALANDRFTVDGHAVRIQKLGTINMTEALRFDGKILRATVRYRAGW
jgi:putative transposase